MFFLIPIGSEEGVRRLPYLTIGLIVVNMIIYLTTSSIYTGQLKAWEDVNERLFDIETRYAYRIIEKDPTFLQEYDIDKIHERFLTEETIPPYSEDYEEWKSLYEVYKKAKENTIFHQLGFTPNKFDAFKIFTSMFVHGVFFHLLFNMLFLWLVGCNIEDGWSWKVFLGLYLMSGVVATLLHFAMFPRSNVPLVGASGAIAGVMGAFMIRHYKTKIRLAYFVWFFFRPFFGTFAIYAGIALPFWFLLEVFYATSWSVDTGTAHWAHVGGFVFGAVVGASFRFFGIEKKYIEPMVEDSFEKLKMSPKMKEANRKLDLGDTAGAIPLLLAVIDEEQQNFDAILTLARIYFEKGHHDDAVVLYNRAFDIVLRRDDRNLILSTYDEMAEKNIVHELSEKNLYSYATFLERNEYHDEAVRIFGLYIECYPSGAVRPKAIYRTYLLFKDKLYNEAMAQSALAFLKKEYPDFPITQ